MNFVPPLGGTDHGCNKVRRWRSREPVPLPLNRARRSPRPIGAFPVKIRRIARMEAFAVEHWETTQRCNSDLSQRFSRWPRACTFASRGWGARNSFPSSSTRRDAIGNCRCRSSVESWRVPPHRADRRYLASSCTGGRNYQRNGSGARRHERDRWPERRDHQYRDGPAAHYDNEQCRRLYGEARTWQVSRRARTPSG